MTKHPVIPAEPGWHVLYVDESNGELFGADPVIAWEVQRHPYAHHVRDDLDHFLCVQPLTVDGRHNAEFLLRPDGQVYEVGAQWWPSLEAANAAELRERRCSPLTRKAQP